MTKEALKLALEVMRNQGDVSVDEWIATEKAIKEALAQPEQEPVAWRYRWSVEGGNWVWNYATYIERQKDDRCEPLYTTPPQRTWVGLTYEDMTKLQKDLYDAKGESVLPTTFAMAVESKLKEKNT
jgi:hypothetical protein